MGKDKLALAKLLQKPDPHKIFYPKGYCCARQMMGFFDANPERVREDIIFEDLTTWRKQKSYCRHTPNNLNHTAAMALVLNSLLNLDEMLVRQ